MKKIEYAKAICYSGFRKGQSPRDGIYPTMEQVKEDLTILKNGGYQYIRMYEPNQHARMTAEAIRELQYDMKLMVGIDPRAEYNNPGCPWDPQDKGEEQLVQNAAYNDEQIEELLRFAKEYDDVVMAISIGNENTPGWGSDLVTVERLIGFAKRLREGSNKIITYNEGSPEWPHLKELGGYLDLICIHTYPLWFGVSVEEAMDVMKQHYQDIVKLYPDKQVIISECGWATMGNRDMKEGAACEENQKKYIKELNQWLEEEKIVAYIFEAFDEPWKGSADENEPEKHWGLYYADRTPKPVLQ